MLSDNPNHDADAADEDPEILAALAAAFGDDGDVDLDDLNLDDLFGENDPLEISVEASVTSDSVDRKVDDKTSVASSPSIDDAEHLLSLLDAAPLGDESSETESPISHFDESNGASVDDDPNSLSNLIARLDEAMEKIGEANPVSNHPIAADVSSTEQRHVIFETAGQKAALSLHHILEIERLPPHTPLPRTPPWCLGIANIRGRIVSVTHVAALVGLPTRTDHQAKVVLTRSEKHDATTAVVVDRVIGLRSLGQTVTKRPEDLRSPLAELASQVARFEDEPILLIDPDRLFSHPEMRPYMAAH